MNKNYHRSEIKSLVFAMHCIEYEYITDK